MYEVTVSCKCCSSWIILKVVVFLFMPSTNGFGCCRILVVDHRLFCNCCIWICVVVPAKSLLFSHIKRFCM